MAWVEIPDKVWGAVAESARGFGVSPDLVVLYALKRYLRKPTAPRESRRRGRPSKFPSELREALRALRDAGVSPGQIAAGRLGDLKEIANGASPEVIWSLRDLGSRYPATRIVLKGPVKDAVAILLRYERGDDIAQLDPGVPILANTDGSAWSARMVAYVSRRRR